LAEESVDQGSRVEQVGERAEERRSGRWLANRHGSPSRQIGPVGGDQRARAVRQDQDQLQPTPSLEPAENFEHLAFKRMMGPNDRDPSRHLDVGSVSCLPSTRSAMLG
jgi:hypothetical protein